MVKRLNYFIAIGIVLIIILAIFFFQGKFSNEEKECQVDSDCIPSGCCHPSSCVSADFTPDCSEVLCSQVCSGPLDCGEGFCGCIDNKCGVVPSKK